MRSIRSVLGAVLFLTGVLGVTLQGCGGGSSPTEPLPPVFGPAVGATVVGQVVSVDGSSSAAAAVAPSAGGQLAVGGPGPVAADVSDITVRVAGTGITDVTDRQGRFRLGEVPGGDQILLFERSNRSGSLEIRNVRSGERIDLTVSLDGSQVRVEQMERSVDAGQASLDVEKSTNGHDADVPPGPTIPAGDPVTWEYRVTNTGSDPLTLISVADDQGVAVSCPVTDLTPGESMTCVGHGTAQPGQYSNLGTATGTAPDGSLVEGSDPSHYFGAEAAIELEKSTNGQDADDPPGPTIAVGDPVSWEYVVTNTGAVDVTRISVIDDQGVAVSCPATVLAPGESMTCSGSGIAQPGQYSNLGTASGTTADGSLLEDSDPSHYVGEDAGSQELTLDLQPDSWNFNWAQSSGTVSALIRGAGFEDVAIDTISLEGSDPAAPPLAPTRTQMAGNHVRAFFAKSEAFQTLLDPQRGEIHTIGVSFMLGGQPVELFDEIRVVGRGN